MGRGVGEGEGWVGLGQGVIQTSGTTDVALPCASQLVRRVLGCPVSRPTGLMTAPYPAVAHAGGRCRRACVYGARVPPVCEGRVLVGLRGTSSHTAAPRLARPRTCQTCGGGGGGGALGWAHSTALGPGGGGGGARSYLCLPYTGTTRGRHGVSAACYCVAAAGVRAHRWYTPAVVYTHSTPQAYGVMGWGSARVLSPGGTAVSKATGGGEISPGDNFAGDNFARGKFRHP